MWRTMKSLLLTFLWVSLCSSGISPVHDIKNKATLKTPGVIKQDSPHKVLKHLDNTLLKLTQNITQNPQMDAILLDLSKLLVSSILSKIETQDKITKLTREALESTGKNKGITAIETRRILDYISRTISGQILSTARASTEPELHRLVYGLAQTAAEVSIIAALKDVTYASAMSKKQSIDMSLRRKRSIAEELFTIATSKVVPQSTTSSNVLLVTLKERTGVTPAVQGYKDIAVPANQFSVLPHSQKTSVQFLKNRHIHTHTQPTKKGFLNQTVLDIENNENTDEQTGEAVVLTNNINGTVYTQAPLEQIEKDNEAGLALGLDDISEGKETIYRPALNADIVAEMEMDQTEIDDDTKNEKKTRQKMDRLESKAKKAILYAGDVAYLTAASVVAMRRALTASIEVQMSVKYAKNGLSNHQELMMNLAKTAAQQAGKEAKSAASKSLTCERVLKLAIKYTAQSNGAKLNHVANRVIMDTLALATIAKSMAYVSSEIAINSLYQATDVKAPS